MDNSELDRLRKLADLDVLRLMAKKVKPDRHFVPVSAPSTSRVHVSAAGVELGVACRRCSFFDTRAHRDGGGAVDLVMHLWRVLSKQAVKMLHKAGA